MKSLLKLASLSLSVLLFSCCKTEAQENEKDARENIRYTDNIISETNSYLQMDSSTHYFRSIEGGYFYLKSVNKNAFYFSMGNSDSLSIRIASIIILTEIMEPEEFFQKSVRDIHSIRIDYYTDLVGGKEYVVKYYDTRSVFTWDTVSYVNRRFHGKGSIEIMDTLYIEHLDNGNIQCFPPQKIEFQFKKYYYE